MEEMIFKPKKISYFIMKLIPEFIFTLVLIISYTIFLIASSNFGNDNFVKNLLSVSIYVYIILGVIFVLSFFWVYFCYKKEKYILKQNKIIYHYWNIFSDNSVELNIDKITEVTMILPFVEHLIFKTWKIQIKTAWSMASKTIFSNLIEVKEVYEKIQEIMRTNGFHLRKDKLVQEAKPHSLWVLFELGWRIISWFFILVIFFLNDLVELQKDINEFQKYLWVLCLVWGIIALIAISIFIINYLDLKRRKYEVYTDSIFYTNWFLTKIYSFLPMEKVSDVENKQWFFSKMFWLHDIIVSSEWVDNQVVFSNMTEWETLIKNIKYLKDAITLTETEILEEKVEEKKVDEVVWFTDKTDFAGNYDRQFSATYSMYLPRVIVTSVFYWFCISVFVFFYIQNIGYILPIFWICTLVVLIKWILDVNFNTFIVDKNTVEHRYEFLTNNHKTFTIDKITWVEFKENIIDKIFKTCSVKFLSIGWNWYINFVSVKKTATFYDDILKKVWIDKKEDFEDLEVVFNLKNFILDSILAIIIILSLFILSLISIIWLSWFAKEDALAWIWILFWILVFVFFILIPILGFIYWKIAYSKRFYRQRLHKSFYESEFWIIFQSKIYSLFKNIKSVEAIKYPFSSAWVIKLDVAWDVAIKDQKSQSISFAWIEIKAEFLENIYNLQNKIDSILEKRTVSEEILEKSDQSIWNSTFILIILFIAIIIWFIYLSIILSSELNSEEISGLKVIWVNVIISAFIILAIRIWYIKSKYYLLQKDRVLTWSGIINKSKKTILYDRINFVEKNQWLLWKIFGNWIVQIYTVWSWNVDMVLEDSKDFRKLYDNLKKD